MRSLAPENSPPQNSTPEKYCRRRRPRGVGRIFCGTHDLLRAYPSADFPCVARHSPSAAPFKIRTCAFGESGLVALQDVRGGAACVAARGVRAAAIAIARRISQIGTPRDCGHVTQPLKMGADGVPPSESLHAPAGPMPGRQAPIAVRSRLPRDARSADLRVVIMITP